MTVFFRPILQLLQHGQRRSTELGDLVGNGNRSGAEDLSLDQADVLDLQAGLLQQLGHGEHRAYAHLVGLEAGDRGPPVVP